MKILAAIAILIAGIAVVFALQNSVPVFVSFLGWQVQQSMALVLLVAFALGAAFGLLVSMPTMIKRMRKIAHLKHQLDDQANDLEMAHQQLDEVNRALARLQPTDPSM